MPAKVSIVIRTKNEEIHLPQTLEAVFNQVEKDIAVVVVDSGSTDATLDIIRRYPVNLLEIPASEFTYGRALNLGIAHSDSPFVVSLSAHATPVDQLWLSSLLAPLRDRRVAGSYGRHLPRPNASGIERLGMSLTGIMDGEPRLQRRRISFSNANGALRREVWQHLPFDESLPGAEDIAWVHQVQRAGYLVAYEPDAAVYHSHGESLWRLLRRSLRDGSVIFPLRLGLRKNTPQTQEWPTQAPGQ